ncbi:secreted RxLR effector peptide protein, putative [Phytophthora infestans T30-4]|uniref:RxLR effector protein PexRD24 n=3 Tax=Phytophthora infestans TaxID=4787 RepID=RD24_PHYIT|nr:secreted RxLR effector peptide protein, putative [Phytophthora infestans T30-4]D0N0Z8.1 RecName: Full=RxLR effector protein PexRD24; Flags: Precursor [Phytophthora infestans T30-4]EEY67311.1 secreted RxLR effector peptide protein, putative [Phytophthora infestans T30-4]KAF4045620.1 RXLR phytopathogen effector protein [Phytophthora infestans]KAF4140046.1 RXLR phytopathogen effector protein [Phytophthora infestans]|eukprot:XP_002905959.1 secreted RxLR effector peptide protein, putative [Phytophthora infestans T30-4]
MHSSLLWLGAVVALLAVNNVTAVSTEANGQVALSTSKGQLAGERAEEENSIVRSLRAVETSEDEEERDLLGLFAKSKLKKMMKSESFKLKRFGEWDDFTVGYIREKLKNKYPDLLLNYLNVYKKAGNEIVRHANNPNKVTFSNKVRARIYKTNS